MSPLRFVLHAVAPLVVASFVGGCSSNFNKQISCSTAADCPSVEDIDHTVTDGMAQSPPPAECCAGVCVIPSTGCDSLYRYVTSRNDVGMCVADPMCPVQPDMATQPDLSEVPDGG